MFDEIFCDTRDWRKWSSMTCADFAGSGYSTMVKIPELTAEEVRRMFGMNDVKVKKVIFHEPATIVFWTDNTKTVVKCQKGDTYNKELGFALCCAKKLLGNKSNFNNEFKKWVN